MAAQLTPGEPGPDADAVAERIRAAGLGPRTFSNGPGDTYARHSHGHHKILFCVDGAITFHTDGGDVPMTAGDRLDLPAGTGHAATVGPDGVVCVEAHTDGPDAL